MVYGTFPECSLKIYNYHFFFLPWDKQEEISPKETADI